MTVESTARKQSFAGGQSALTFTFRALVDSPEDIKVVAVTSGTETLLTYGVDYAVTISTDGIGGVVVVSPSYSTAYTYTVYRETTNLQESDYDDYNQFPADTLEEDLDRRAMVSQEISEDSGRTLKVQISSALTGSSLSLPEPAAGEALVWNATEDGLENSGFNIADVEDYASTASTAALAAESAQADAEAAQVAAEAAAASVPSYVRGTFNNAAVTTGTIAVTCSTVSAPYNRQVTVANSNGTLVIPDDVTFAVTSVTIDMTSYLPIAGTWGYVIL